MLSYAEQRFLKAAQEARNAGLDAAAMHSMVNNIIAHESAPAEPATSADVVYDELPEGLIDLPSAAKRYDCATARLRTMVHRGKLTARGRLKAPAYGGGYVLLDERELAEVMANPPPKGRPKN